MIDDDYADYVLIEETLKGATRTRFQVSHVSDYESAREAFFSDEYDVFLLDYFLGAETANQLLHEARRIRLVQPIVVLTGVGHVEIDDQVIHMGASDFLPKEELSSPLLERIIRHAVEHKRSENRMELLIKQDALTGLGNRQIFEELLEHSLATAARHKSKLAVMFLDLDRFKEVNDTLGHPVGDLLLILVADRLRKLIRDSDFIARIGGDEFTILLDDIASYDDAALVAEKLIHSLAQPSAINGNHLVISSSVGIAVYPENGDTPIKLMQKADMALYEAKRKGAGQFQFFTGNLQTQLEESIRIEKGLREALEKDQLELHLQPQWRLEDQQITGFEGLIRWRQEDGQLLSPGVFVPVAEKTGLILPVGRWVLAKACDILAKWEKAGHNNFSIAVNVSPMQLRTPDFVEGCNEELRASGIDPSRLELELTEDVFLDTSEEQGATLRDLKRLKSLGMNIAIDDFGTGYSSLRYLKDFPIDKIKIDKSFVSSAMSEELSEPAIAKAVVMIAQSLGLSVIAEGIETQAQMAALKERGCIAGQGFLLSASLPEKEALKFALEHNEKNAE